MGYEQGLRDVVSISAAASMLSHLRYQRIWIQNYCVQQCLDLGTSQGTTQVGAFLFFVEPR